MKNVILNVVWLLFEKLGVLAFSLIASILVARHLGADEFGDLNYALALFGILSPLTYLGLTSILIKELVRYPKDHNVLMGSAFFLKLMGSLSIIVIFSFTSYLYIEDVNVRKLVWILSITSIFDSFGIIGYWYLSKSQSKYFAIASILSASMSSIVKIVFVYLEKPLIWFGFAAATQVVFLSISLLALYVIHKKNIFDWKVSFNYSLGLINKSWPLALSAFFALIYLKVDQVMLGYLSSSKDLGLYSAAARLSEVWYVLPTALATAIFPTIIKMKGSNKASFLESLYRIVFYTSFVIVLPIYFLSDIIVYYLYGTEFRLSGEILSIHIWACPVMFMGAIYSKVLISENLLVYGLIRDIAGAILNIALNFYLIPSYGGKGAAVATVVSYTFSSYILCFVFSKTRVSGFIMTKAMIRPYNISKSIRVLRTLI